MGSAVLREAISAIRDWSVDKDIQPAAGGAAETFGSLVFGDAEQEKRLPKAAVAVGEKARASSSAPQAEVVRRGRVDAPRGAARDVLPPTGE